MGYYEDLEISPDLQKEWKTQAGLYMSYASQAIVAQDELDVLTDSLTVAEAKIDLAIRDGSYELLPPNFKVTEGAIKSLLNADPTLISLRRNILESKKEAGLLKKAEIAFEHRKKALENLVIITGREYYSEPRVNTVTEKLNKELENTYGKI
jgi:uncharacterized protein YjaG (DUF416 family)